MTTVLALAAGLVAGPAAARTAAATNAAPGASVFAEFDAVIGVVRSEAPAPVAGGAGPLQCVPYARGLTGIDIHGDARTWWDQAAGRYARGSRPRVGAVLAIQPFAGSQLGHVAAVSKVIDARHILVSHANWSTRGGIENDVEVLDVSPDNDWSEVRVWYSPIGGLGTTRWPVAGFIYNAPAGPQTGSPANVAAESAPAGQMASRKAAMRTAHADPIGAIISGDY